MVVGESDTLDMVIHPLDAGAHISVVGLQSWEAASLPLVFVALPEFVSDRRPNSIVVFPEHEQW